MKQRPHRIQRLRTKGWKMPANTIYVGRPSRWGNPWKVGLVNCSCRAVGECNHNLYRTATTKEAFEYFEYHQSTIKELFPEKSEQYLSPLKGKIVTFIRKGRCKMVDEYKKEFGGWWLWILLLVAISIPVLWGLGAVGIFGKTVAERVIFEQSYQKKAGDKTKLRIFEAQKAAIQKRLSSSNITSDQRTELEAQLSAIEIQLTTVGGN